MPALKSWIDGFATVSNAIAELISANPKESTEGTYAFLDRSKEENLVQLKIDTNAKVCSITDVNMRL